MNWTLGVTLAAMTLGAGATVDDLIARQSKAVGETEPVCDDGKTTECVERRRALNEPECQKGNFKACLDMANSYMEDPVDLKRAIPLYERACDGGLAEGCSVLGGVYESSLHRELRDPRLAAEYYERARVLLMSHCEQNDGLACAGLVGLFERKAARETNPGQRASLETKARKLLDMECRQGRVSSCTDLVGFCTRNGTDDDKCLLSGYSRACDLGDGESCWVLGWTYRRGAHGIREDPREASRYFQRACRAGYRAGCGISERGLPNP